MIRAAALSDVLLIEALLLRLKMHSEYATVPVDRERGRKMMRHCISSPQGFAWVAEHREKLCGVLLGIKQPIWFSARLSATDIVFYSQRPGDGRALVEQFTEWAWKDPRVEEVLCAQSSGHRVGRTDHWYQNLGFTRVGSVHRLARWDSATARVAL
jgi:N-acetylglutamate synthase-like GNAT family acetyltransferase